MSNKLPTRGSFLGPGGNGNWERDALCRQARYSAVDASAAQMKASETSIDGIAVDSNEGGRAGRLYLTKFV